MAWLGKWTEAMRVLLVSRVLDHLPEKERAALLAQNPIMISMDNATRTAFNTEACHRAAKNLALPHCMVLVESWSQQDNHN